MIFSRDFFKFLIIGGLTTVLGYSIYFGLIYFLSVHYAAALVMEYAISICFSYWLNKKYIFKGNPELVKEFSKFASVYILSLAANYLLLLLAVDVFKFSELISQLVILFLIALVSFFGHRKWTFA
jgi:putative flippase GtrA